MLKELIEKFSLTSIDPIKGSVVKKGLCQVELIIHIQDTHSQVPTPQVFNQENTHLIISFRLYHSLSIFPRRSLSILKSPNWFHNQIVVSTCKNVFKKIKSSRIIFGMNQSFPIEKCNLASLPNILIIYHKQGQDF